MMESEKFDKEVVNERMETTSNLSAPPKSAALDSNSFDEIEEENHLISQGSPRIGQTSK